MDRHRQFDHAQPRAEMPARRADGGNRLGAQFVGKLPELAGLQPTQIRGRRYRIEQRRFGKIGHYEASRSEEHTSELQSLMRISYAVFCLKKKKPQPHKTIDTLHNLHT